MSAPPKKIVVAGGTGFLGSRICKAAAARKWHVVSLSRRGTPTWSEVTSSPQAPAWASDVEWAKADLLKPGSYAAQLEGADAVVHSMGILLEADYKGALTGKEGLISGLQRAFASAKLGSQNPLERKSGEELRPQEKDGQLTYELMNRDSAIALAQESAAKKVGTFVYISAAGGAPILPARYISTKREAETTIGSSLPSLRSVFIRPGFLYDSSRAFTVPLAYATFPGAALNTMLGRRLSAIAGAAVERPLQADLVANAVVEAIENETVRGPVVTEEIESLANKAWRKGML